MIDKIMNKYGIRQIGYSVKSIEETAELLYSTLGAGPFIDLGVNSPAECKIRGVESPVTMRTAIGYLGTMELELIEDMSEGPSPYNETGYYGYTTTASGSMTWTLPSPTSPLQAWTSPWT